MRYMYHIRRVYPNTQGITYKVYNLREGVGRERSHPPGLIGQLLDHGPGLLSHATVARHEREGRKHHFIKHGEKAVVDLFLLLRGQLSIVLIGCTAFQESPSHPKHLGKKRSVQVDLWTKTEKHVKDVWVKLFWF